MWEIGLDPLLGGGKYLVHSNDNTYSVCVFSHRRGAFALRAPGNPASGSACFSSSCPFSPSVSDFWPLALLFCLCVFLMPLKPQSPLFPRFAIYAQSISNLFASCLEKIQQFGNQKNKKQIIQPIQIYICGLSMCSLEQCGEMKTHLTRRPRPELGSYLMAFLRLRKEQLSLC